MLNNFKKCTFYFSLIYLAGCQPQPMQTTANPALGSDRDANGCIGSAGYTWCNKLQQCVRPWELAAEKGFNNDAQSFKSFCENP